MSGIKEPELRHVGLKLGNRPSGSLMQLEADVFGFWVFLMSDALIFALLFSVFGTMLNATAGAPRLDAQFEIKSAFLETVLLLTSSFTFGMVSLSLKRGARRRWVAFWLTVTFCLGAYFLRLESQDFTTVFHDGVTPQTSGAVSSYFVLVGTHGLHVTIGMIWILIMGAQMAVHGLDERVKVNFIRLALFWHFLDVVWVFIFSVVYLRGLLHT